MNYLTTHFLNALTFTTTFWLIPLLIVVFATYSITRLIVEDTIADKLRNKFFDRFPHEGYQTKNRPKRGKWTLISGGVYHVTEGTKWGELISCPWCSGFYVALAVWAAFTFAPVVTTFLLFPWALRVVPGLLSGGH